MATNVNENHSSILPDNSAVYRQCYYAALRYVRLKDSVVSIGMGGEIGCKILFEHSKARSVCGLDSATGGVFAFGETDDYEIDTSVSPTHSFPDNSVDYIVSVDYFCGATTCVDALKEMFRILRPSGRIFIFTTNADQLPQCEVLHHHLCDAGFIIEEASHLDGCARFLCMKSPLLGEGVKYVDFRWKTPNVKEFNVTNFARDYINPYLVRGMMQIGERNNNAIELEKIRQAVMQKYPQTSADYGAALCGEIYYKMNFEAKSEDLAELKRRAFEYMDVESDVPHVVRWQISIAYAIGKLLQKNKCVGDAKVAFTRCAEFDALRFSPLIGTKTASAMMEMAIMEYQGGSAENAKEWLHGSLGEVERLCKASWLNAIGADDEPNLFGHSELSDLLDIGRRSANFLYALDNFADRRVIIEDDLKGLAGGSALRRIYELQVCLAQCERTARENYARAVHDATRVEFARMSNTPEYVIGSIITWPFRMTVGVCACLRQNGPAYTVHRIPLKFYNIFNRVKEVFGIAK